MTTEGRMKAAFNSGCLRGVEMGRAVLEDNWDRQAYVQERKQREQQIANTFSPDVGAEYNKGFVVGLMGYPKEIKLAEDEAKVAEVKIQEWIENLKPLGEKARADGRQYGKEIAEAAQAQDRLRMNAILAQIEDAKRSFLGIQRREFDHGYMNAVHDFAKNGARARALEVNDVKRELYMAGVPERP